MENEKYFNKTYKMIIFGFISGFFATLTFYEVALWLLREASIAPFSPFAMTATQPWGIPALFSLALWGGVWGVLFAFVQGRFPRDKAYWVTAFGFGAILPTLIALLIVAPMKGRPLGGGWHWQLLVTAPLINGAWGIGTGIFFNLLVKLSQQHEAPATECRPGMLCE
jgi:hypothetical protein